MANVQAATPAAKVVAPVSVRSGGSAGSETSFEDVLSRVKPKAKADAQGVESGQEQAGPVEGAKGAAAEKRGVGKAGGVGRERKAETSKGAEAGAGAANGAGVGCKTENVEAEGAKGAGANGAGGGFKTENVEAEAVKGVAANGAGGGCKTANVKAEAAKGAVGADEGDGEAQVQAVVAEAGEGSVKGSGLFQGEAKGVEVVQAVGDAESSEESETAEKAEEGEEVAWADEGARSAEAAVVAEQAAAPVAKQKGSVESRGQDGGGGEHGDGRAERVGVGSGEAVVVESEGKNSGKQRGEHQSEGQSMAGRGGAEVMVNREVVEKPEGAGRTQGRFGIEEQLPSGQGLGMPGADRVETVGKPTAASVAGSVEVPFAEANHSEIITGIRTHLLPSGGSMRIWLDPPELGAMQVTVQIQDGVVTASFETSSDDATRLLSHSLHQLKQSLEVQGISVAKLQVEQSSREKFGGGTREEGERGQPQDQGSQQEQQRRELLQRMWRRLRGGSNALDVTG